MVGNVPPVGMGVDEGEHSSTIEIPASLCSEDRSPSDRNAKDRLWPPGFHTQNSEGHHAPRSFRRANRLNLLIVRTRDQPGFGRHGASGSSCRRSALHTQLHFEVPEFRPGLSCFDCAVLVLGNCGRPLRYLANEFRISMVIEAYNPILQYSDEVKATKHLYCCSRDADTTFLGFWSFHCRPQSGRQASGFAIHSHFLRFLFPNIACLAGRDRFRGLRI